TPTTASTTTTVSTTTASLETAQLCNEATQRSSKGMVKEAIELFTEALELNQDKTYYNQRGLAHRRCSQFEEAIQDYNKALKIDPNFVVTYCNRAVTFNTLGLHQRAADDFAKALQVSPTKDKRTGTSTGKRFPSFVRF